MKHTTFSCTGKIIANQTVDYEQVQWLNFTVKASDNGSPPRSSEVPVCLEIVDINDNNPIFSQPSYQVNQLQRPVFFLETIEKMGKRQRMHTALSVVIY